MKEYHKKEIFKIVFSIIAFLASISFIFIDMIFSFGKEIEISFQTANSISLTILTVIFTVWYSYLLVIKQIYSNRYVSNEVKKFVNKNQLCLVFNFVWLFILGLGLSLFGNKLFVSNILFCVLSFIFMVLCGIDIYRKIDKNEINLAVKNNINSIISNIKDSTDKDKIDKNLSQLNNIYTDCAYKNDIATCKQIVISYTEFLKQHLVCKSEKRIANKEEIVENEQDAILFGFTRLFIRDNSDFSIKINNFILNKIFKLSNIAIKCNDDLTLKQIVGLYSRFIYIIGTDNNYLIFIYKYMTDITNLVIDKNEKDEFEIVANCVVFITEHVLFNNNDLNPLNLNFYYYQCLLHCFRGEDSDVDYSYYSKMLFSQWIDLINNEKFRDSKIVYTILSELMENKLVKENQTAKLCFYNYIEELIKRKYTYSSDIIVEFISYSLDKFEENKSFDLDKIYGFRNIFSHNAILYMQSVPGYIFPDYVKMSKLNLTIDKEQNKYAEDILELISLSISKNYNRNLVILLKEVGEIICLFEQQNKANQLIWLNVFFKAFYIASLSDNQQANSIIFRYLKTSIRDMDNDRKISKDLGLTIIDNIVGSCQSRFRENIDIVCEMVEFLDDLLSIENNFYFINKNNEVRMKVFQAIFSIGIDAIEKNLPLVIQRVSNIIGWLIYHSIEDAKSDNAEALINYAIQLYSLCFENDIERHTIVFVGTLFVIIGAYCKYKSKFKYYNVILSKLKKVSKCKDYICVSKQLRVNTSDGWEILGDDPKKLMNDFISDFNKYNSGVS